MTEHYWISIFTLTESNATENIRRQGTGCTPTGRDIGLDAHNIYDTLFDSLPVSVTLVLIGDSIIICHK